VCASLYHADRCLYIPCALAQCYLNDDEDWHDALYTAISILAFAVAKKLTTTRMVIAAAMTLEFLVSIESGLPP